MEWEKLNNYTIINEWTLRILGIERREAKKLEEGHDVFYPSSN